MNIVVLDGHTLNPGDLRWSELESLGSCAVYDRTDAGEILARCRNAEIVLTNKVPLTADIIAQLPDLKYIGVTATGYNIVDIAAARQRGIVVTNIPSYSTPSVAQLVFALILELTHRTGHHADAVRSGRWSAQSDFSFRDFPLMELAGKNFGIIGFGNIGRATAAIAAAFEMKVLVATRSPENGRNEFPSYRFLEIEPLLRQSDIVSLHCALTPETDHLMNAERLGWMKPSALLINTGRGGLIDEPALLQALRNRTIAGAGLDVLSSEPPPPEHPLLTAEHCVITPHIGWATIEARTRLMEAVVRNVRSFLNGSPINVVS